MVQGLSELRARWSAIPRRVTEAAQSVLEKQAEDVVAMMRRLVPVDKGDLRKGIRWTWGDAPKGSLTIGSVVGREYGTLRITIYAGGRGKNDAFYAAFQEFGTVKMAANPFFFPAWRAKRKKVKSAITRAMNKAIREG